MKIAADFISAGGVKSVAVAFAARRRHDDR
jgi:hypothetical protein